MVDCLPQAFMPQELGSVNHSAKGRKVGRLGADNPCQPGPPAEYWPNGRAPNEPQACRLPTTTNGAGIMERRRWTVRQRLLLLHGQREIARSGSQVCGAGGRDSVVAVPR